MIQVQTRGDLNKEEMHKVNRWSFTMTIILLIVFVILLIAFVD